MLWEGKLRKVIAMKQRKIMVEVTNSELGNLDYLEYNGWKNVSVESLLELGREGFILHENKVLNCPRCTAVMFIKNDIEYCPLCQEDMEDYFKG